MVGILDHSGAYKGEQNTFWIDIEQEMYTHGGFIDKQRLLFNYRTL